MGRGDVLGRISARISHVDHVLAGAVISIKAACGRNTGDVNRRSDGYRCDSFAILSGYGDGVTTRSSLDMSARQEVTIKTVAKIYNN